MTALTGLVTPQQHKCITENPQTKHITTALTTRATPSDRKHSTQRDIAVRERAYFLWGSSPCLEWRVYTHNASPARRGGSPGQSAPPLGSPGSTGPGPLWCRTGRRHSPCYLQVKEGDRDGDGWVFSVLRSVKPEPLIQFYNPWNQAGAERENKAVVSANWIKESLFPWMRASLHVWALRNSQNHFAPIKCVYVLWFGHNVSCFGQQSYALLHPRCSQSIFILVDRELFIHWETSLRRDASITLTSGHFCPSECFSLQLRPHWRITLPW